MDTNSLLQGARDAITVKRIFGDPYERDGVTVIPVAAVGGGGGGGGDEAGNGGGGYGLNGRPVGVYVVKDGDVSWQPAIDASRIALRGQLIAIIALLVLRGVLKARARRRRRTS